MTRIYPALLLAAAVFHAHAVHAADAAGGPQSCAAAGGSYLTGAIVQGPKFAHGQFRQGIELSHTHLKVKADQDGRLYDVAIDNVFANGYQPGARGVPAPLDTLHAGQRLALCGQLYDRGVGIHFVHTNCGQAPTANHPDGYVRVIEGGGAGPNLEGNGGECSLFGGADGATRKKKLLHWTLH
jgi:hypothetical protein